MVYKALQNVFWIWYIKWYKFCNNNLSVVLWSKQEGTLKLMNPKHDASIQLLILLVLTFLFTLPRCQVIFQWKFRKCLKLVKEYSRRFELANGKYLRRAWEGELHEIKRIKKYDKEQINIFRCHSRMRLF